MTFVLVVTVLSQVEKVRLGKSVLVLIINFLGNTGFGSSSRHQKRRKFSSNVRELFLIFLFQFIFSGSR